MKLNYTLKELNAFMESAFTPDAIKILRLHVDIQPDPHIPVIKSYPEGVEPAHYAAYDVALSAIRASNSKIAAIKAVREVMSCSLKDGRDLVEKWFPGVPVS